MDLDGYFRFVMALLFVLALIALLTWLARRFGLGGAASGPKAAFGKRIGVVEVATLDGRRKLVLLRRDAVEHLIVLGPNSETVVETGISAPAPPDKSQDRVGQTGPAKRSFKAIIGEVSRRGRKPKRKARAQKIKTESAKT